MDWFEKWSVAQNGPLATCSLTTRWLPVTSALISASVEAGYHYK
jgi:hypothetical protein